MQRGPGSRSRHALSAGNAGRTEHQKREILEAALRRRTDPVVEPRPGTRATDAGPRPPARSEIPVPRAREDPVRANVRIPCPSKSRVGVFIPQRPFSDCQDQVTEERSGHVRHNPRGDHLRRRETPRTRLRKAQARWRGPAARSQRAKATSVSGSMRGKVWTAAIRTVRQQTVSGFRSPVRIRKRWQGASTPRSRECANPSRSPGSPGQLLPSPSCPEPCPGEQGSVRQAPQPRSRTRPPCDRGEDLGVPGRGVQLAAAGPQRGLGHRWVGSVFRNGGHGSLLPRVHVSGASKVDACQHRKSGAARCPPGTVWLVPILHRHRPSTRLAIDKIPVRCAAGFPADTVCGCVSSTASGIFTCLTPHLCSAA